MSKLKQTYLAFKIHGFKEGMENTCISVLKWIIKAKNITVSFDNRLYANKTI